MHDAREAAQRFHALVRRAARRYRPAGRGAYHFARGKLGGDPVFAALLRQGLIADGARLVDLGCGQGVLMALLEQVEDDAAGPTARPASAVPAASSRSSAPAAADASHWPASWAPPPRRLTMQGVDLRADAVAVGAVALRGRARIEHGDIRHFDIPPCDLITILDVLHYIDAEAQDAVIGRCAAALGERGTLLLRAGDASRGLAFRFTLFCDWVVTAVRGHWRARFHARTAAGWVALLERHGFGVQVQPMGQGTPFANVLLVARRGQVSFASGDPR